MNRTHVALLLAYVLTVPAASHAASVVFAGDPTNPVSGQPYEILPGYPLVLPGPDGIVGTADDVLNTSILGDIDLVVRSGSPPASEVLPPPLAHSQPSSVPVGVAGSVAGGGTPIPFTVFLSDGASSSASPSGQLLAAADMNGIPVIVTAFGDLDRDGFIGPTNRDKKGALDNALEVQELEPVGRAVALFNGGVARGSVAIRAGLPSSQDGLRVVLTALALTGPFDPSFFAGSIPSGPAISTAQPFVLQRDLSRLIRDRAVAVGPTTTLQDVVKFASIPSASGSLSFALPLDGSVPTVDVARVLSQPAVGAALREEYPKVTLQHRTSEQLFGTTGPANRRRLRVIPTDRWGNPADPPKGFALTVRTVPPMRIVGSARVLGERSFKVRSAKGTRVTLSAPLGTANGTTGTVTAERNGVVVSALNYRVDERVNRPPADMTVPSKNAATIQEAIDRVSDKNQDGTLVVELGPGIFRENVVVHRSVTLRGNSQVTTIIEGDGTGSTLAVTAPNAMVQRLTVVGGASGVALSGNAAGLTDSRAWRNLGAGVTISGASARLWHATLLNNDGDGVSAIGAGGLVCSASSFVDNGGIGANFSTVQNAQFDNNVIADNGTGGIGLTAVSASIVADNQSVNNLAGPNGVGGEGAVGVGIGVFSSQSNQIVGNLSARNDDSGLHVDQTSGNLISQNVLDDNGGYGMFVRRSTDDFDATPGTQDAPGDNRATGNRKGDVFIRTR
jgi:hypothetical protein